MNKKTIYFIVGGIAAYYVYKKYIASAAATNTIAPVTLLPPQQLPISDNPFSYEKGYL